MIIPDPTGGEAYQVEGPALISFSGGRSSAYMLHEILRAHDGVLPPDVHVVFANTGKEAEETLRFVHECGARWGVRVRWLEWVDREGRQTAASDRFVEVGLNSAARRGEPLKALFRRKGYLPNAVTRFCTADAKIDTMKQFMLSLGYEKWINVVGLRFDEGHRILKQANRNRLGKERWRSIWPLAKAEITKPDVTRFWLGDNADPRHLTHPLPQGFDLGLRDYEGNCDGCFLKGDKVLMFQEREKPGVLDWWAEAEAEVTATTGKPDGARFVTEYSYADLQRYVAQSQLLIPLDWRTLPAAVECTTDTCGDETPGELRALQAEFEAQP